jgi:hypothetical protein
MSEIPRAAAIGIAADSLERVVARLMEIAKIDGGPSSLIKCEAEIIRKRIEQIRAALPNVRVPD